MYYTHIRDLVTDDPFPMYQTVSELIEADGEAEDLFLQETVNNGYVNRFVYVIDEKSRELIKLNITDYIGDKAFQRFESVINNYTEEDGELSRTKIESWYLACLKAKR